jgi:hypothetical protein
VGAEIFGDPLPHSVLGWLILLGGILGTLRVVLAAAQEFAEFVGIDQQIERPFGGLALPIGWAAWCVALLVGRHDVVSVLIVLIGTLTITVAARLLIRKCRA